MIEKKTIISDQEILDTFKRSPEAGMKLFLDKFERPLFSLLRSILRLDEDTDDAYQNTCVKIYLHLDRYKGKSSLYTWAYRIATNEALSLLRKRKRILSESDTVLKSHEATTNVDYDELLHVFHEAIDRLPSRQQLVFQMRYYGNYSYEDIARFTERSVGGLKANYHHAKKKIEEHIKSQTL